MYISGILIARSLTLDDYGRFGLVKTLVLSGSLIYLMGLPNEIVRYVTQNDFTKDSRVRELISSITGFLTIVFAAFILIVYLFREELSSVLFEDDQYPELMVLAAIYIYGYAMSVLMTNFMNGLSLFESQAKINSFTSILVLPLIYFLTKTMGLNGSVLALASLYLLQAALYYNSISRYGLKISRLHFKWKAVTTALRLSKFLFLHEMLYAVSASTLIIIVSRVLNFSSLGIYNAGHQLSMLILFIPTSLLGYLLNRFSKQDKTVSDKKLINRFFILSFTYLGLMGAVFLIFEDLPQFIYGSEFDQLSSYMVLFILLCFPQLLNSVFQQRFISLSKSNVIFIITTIVSIIQPLSAYIVLNRSGSVTYLLWVLISVYMAQAMTYVILNRYYVRNSRN